MMACVEAYGCSLNVGEAVEIEDMLLERGWELGDSPLESDLVFLVTCVVVEKTERAMLRRLRELACVGRLVVTGCMATALREGAEGIVPGASFIPPGDMARISDIVPVVGPPRPSRRGNPGSVVVPIASGCIGSCSYCISRLARGTLASRPSAGIVEAVRAASANGPVEVRLSAQDAAAYGREMGDDLPSLVGRICDIPQDFRLRIGMMNPRNILPMADRVAEMFTLPKVFRFLHIPVQSGSDAVLARMGRGHSREDFIDIVRRVRSRAPDIAVSTDIIVGYPGETVSDHEANLEVVREVRPDIVNVTRFSPRKGTPAASETPRIVGWVAKERSREMADVRFEVSLERNREWVGRTVSALATERGKPGTTIMRTDEYRQVVVPEELPLGLFFPVLVEGATPTYLSGSRCDVS